MPRCPKRAIFDMGWEERMSPVITHTLLGNCWGSLFLPLNFCTQRANIPPEGQEKSSLLRTSISYVPRWMANSAEVKPASSSQNFVGASSLQRRPNMQRRGITVYSPVLKYFGFLFGVLRPLPTKVLLQE